MQKSTGTRIDKLMEVLKLSQLEFAESLSVTSGAITNWKKRDLGINVINKIVNTYPQVSREWLMTGEGPIFKEIKASVTESPHLRGLSPDIIAESVGPNAPFYLPGAPKLNPSAWQGQIKDEAYQKLLNAADLFTDQSLQIERYIVMLKGEIQEMKDIKATLAEELGTIRDLKAQLHDAVRIFQSAGNKLDGNYLMAAETEG